MNLTLECEAAAKLSADKLSAAKLIELSDSFMKQQSPHLQSKYRENLAVVDSNQNHIGSANWYFVHYFGFNYTATAVLVFNKDTNRYALQQRSATVSWPNLLDCSAGGCCPDTIITEHDRLAHAQKELAEELFHGYPLAHHFPLEKLGHFFSSYELQTSEGYFYKKHFIHFYRYDITSDQQGLLTHNQEVQSIVHLSKAEILTFPENRLAPGLLTAINSGIF